MTGLHVDGILIISYLLQYLDTIRIVTHQTDRYLFRYRTMISSLSSVHTTMYDTLPK
jgi:hypothetical protein